MLYQSIWELVEAIALNVRVPGLEKQGRSAQPKLAYAFSRVLVFGDGVWALGV